MTPGRPHIAIVDPNVLATIGLRQLLQTVVPMMADALAEERQRKD